MSSGLFKNVINKMYLEIIYLIYMYKKDLALDNLKWLICNKTKPNQMKKRKLTSQNIIKIDIVKCILMQLNIVEWSESQDINTY